MKKVREGVSIYPDKPVVYFVSDGKRHCKVGISKNFGKRMSSLQVGNAHKITPICFITCNTMKSVKTFEYIIHRILKDHRLKGEWFEEPAVLDVIDLIAVVTSFVETSGTIYINPERHIGNTKLTDLQRLVARESEAESEE